MTKLVEKVFGYSGPLKVEHYNSMIGTVGCVFLADSINEFVGMVLVLEAVLVTIERCYRRDM